MVGRTISHYEVLDQIGEGGMGVVYKARDTHLDRFVAIKVLPADRITDETRRRRFVQEAKAASALNHPNIITVHEISEEGGTHFIVMEWVEGKTLSQLVALKRLPLSETNKYAVQMADALWAAHGKGIVHRDLKPGNVMVTGTGLVKILDFGLAKLTEARASTPEALETRTMAAPGEPLTEEGTIVGTVAYMSPEQAEGKPLDARSDIFSFGSLLYEMATGRPAFSGETKMATLAAILHHDPKPVRAIVQAVPSELDKLIARCLRKDPDRRFQSMRDVKSALEEFAAPAPRSNRSLLARWAAAFLVCFVLAGAFLWLLSDRAGTPSHPLAAIPLTSYPGLEHHPTFSPDGRQVAFSWNRDSPDKFSIYLKLIGPGPPFRLTTHSANDRSPSWSPDGRTIAFLRDVSPDRAAVMLIPSLGGPERRLAEIYTPDYLQGHYLAWTPDGRALVVSDKASPDRPFALYLLPVDAGEKRQLTLPPAQQAGDSGPAFSPDGRVLAFTRSTTAFVSDLYCATVSEPYTTIQQVRRVTVGQGAMSGAAWAPDGHSIIFSSNYQGTTSLWRVLAFRSGKPQRVPSVGEDAYDPVISRQTNRLVYSRQQADINIWRTRGRLGHGQRTQFIASTRVDADPDFSADGKKVAFSSDRSGHDEVWICDIDGSNPMQLTSFGGAPSGSPRWSPDAKRIAFDANATGQWQIYVVDADGGRPQRITNSPATDVVPTWSRNGKWMYFASNRSGEFQVWRVSANGGEAVQVTKHGGYMALESPDGNYVYHTKNRGEATSLWRVPTGGGEEIQVLPLLDERGFAVVDHGIYFRAPEAQSRSYLFFLQTATNSITPVAEFDRSLFNGFCVSPNEHWILYAQTDQRAGDLVLVENVR